MRTLYRARTIHTLSYPTTGEWMLVDGRHVQRVGTGEAPEADRVIDLPGATIIPGFIDTHVHLTATGMRSPTATSRRPTGAQACWPSPERARGTRARPHLHAGLRRDTMGRPELPDLAELGAATDRPL